MENSLRLLARNIGVSSLVLALCSCSYISSIYQTTPVESPQEDQPLTRMEALEAIPLPMFDISGPRAVERGEPVLLRANHPTRYRVVKGDNLWDISGRFLRTPWRWPELWQSNPQVINPHLIYPEDILVLYYDSEGRPGLYIEGQDGGRRGARDTMRGLPTVEYSRDKLKPSIRRESRERAIPSIPLNAISQFLTSTQLLSEEELDEAPYIVATADEHLLAAAGFKVYVRKAEDVQTSDFTVVRKGREFRNSDDDLLGFEATYLAEARILAQGDPATAVLTSAKREVFKGDRLIASRNQTLLHNFYPHAPKQQLSGEIVAVMNGVKRIGQFDTVVLDLGKRDGVEEGHVLVVKQGGSRVRDTIAGGSVKLPSESAGLAMVYRVFDTMSFAIVMKATRSLRIWDNVLTP